MFEKIFYLYKIVFKSHQEASDLDDWNEAGIEFSFPGMVHY